MLNLTPPTLDQRGTSIPFRAQIVDSNVIDFLTIPINKKQFSTDAKHIQITIRNKTTGESAVNPRFSPDRGTLFISVLQGRKYIVEEGDYYLVKVPYNAFVGGKPQKTETYVVQLRFGGNQLWEGSQSGLDGAGHLDFARWKKQSTSQSPSLFGEWSTQQTIYCHDTFYASLTLDTSNFIPVVKFLYQGQQEDPLDFIELIYTYRNLNNEITKKKALKNDAIGGEIFQTSCSLGIAPLVDILVSVEGYTRNYTLIKDQFFFSPKHMVTDGDLGHFVDYVLEGDEADDGCLAKTLMVTMEDFYRKE